VSFDGAPEPGQKDGWQKDSNGKLRGGKGAGPFLDGLIFLPVIFLPCQPCAVSLDGAPEPGAERWLAER